MLTKYEQNLQNFIFTNLERKFDFSIFEGLPFLKLAMAKFVHFYLFGSGNPDAQHKK